MSYLNQKHFEILLTYTHEHPNGRYILLDNDGEQVEAMYDTDYESDNGLDENEEGYEEYHCILFQRISDQSLFEVNYHFIPIHVICDGMTVY